MTRSGSWYRLISKLCEMPFYPLQSGTSGASHSLWRRALLTNREAYKISLVPKSVSCDESCARFASKSFPVSRSKHLNYRSYKIQTFIDLRSAWGYVLWLYFMCKIPPIATLQSKMEQPLWLSVRLTDDTFWYLTWVSYLVSREYCAVVKCTFTSVISL